MTELALEIIDAVHGKALIAAARAMNLPHHFTRRKIAGVSTPCRIVEVSCAAEAYRYGGEVMKRWRAALGRT